MPREMDWIRTRKRLGFSCRRGFRSWILIRCGLRTLHQYVTELPGFVGDAAKSNEGLLEAIQAAWNEEYEDAKG